MAAMKPAAALFHLVVFTVIQYSRAQIYDFLQTEVPSNRSLHTLYAFYVYSHEEAPGRHLGPPFVRFSNLAAKPTAKPGIDLSAYKGLQISIMRYREFWDLINPEKFCSMPEDVKPGGAESVDTLLMQYKSKDTFVHNVAWPSTEHDYPADVKKLITSTGVYILVFSNCGAFDRATVSGSVIVKNAYGFLPGIEYHKMPFYGWLLLVYAVLAVVWLGLSIRWWKELFNIQNCISAVIFFGLAECFLWYIFFSDWNNSGHRGKVVFILAIWFTVVKSCFSYMLVLVASLGWGVTRPFLDRDVITKIQAVSFLYIVFDFVRETVLSFRHSHSLSLTFVMLCLLPVSLMNGGIFYWVFSALSNLTDTLKERRQSEKLVVFNRLWMILVASLTVASAALLFQFFDLSRDNTGRWKYQWLFADGISHFLFLVVLVSMMYLWAPHRYSQRYAYSQQVDNDNDDDGGAPEAVWADEDVLDDGEEDQESFWAATSGKGKDADEAAAQANSRNRAEVIGAASEA